MFGIFHQGTVENLWIACDLLQMLPPGDLRAVQDPKRTMACKYELLPVVLRRQTIAFCTSVSTSTFLSGNQLQFSPITSSPTLV